MVAVTTQEMKFSIKDFFSKFDQISSFLKFPKLDYPRVCLIIIQNIGDKEYFKWCLVRKLHPANNQPTRITKADKDFARKVLKFPVEIRDIHKIEKILSPLVFFVMNIRKDIKSMYQKML